MQKYNRRAKIVCTLGPSSSNEAQILALAEAGMNVARLNFSHGTHEEHRQRIEIIRKVAYELGQPIAILQDLQGPKIRVGKFENGQTELKRGDLFTLTTRQVIGSHDVVSVSYPDFVNDVRVGDLVLLDDGLLELRVEQVDNEDVLCRVEFGGVLKDHKGLNLPNSILTIDVLGEKDRADLEFGLKMGVDYVALSFVQKPEDVFQLKRLIAQAGYNTPVVAKIEKPQAVESISQILDVADAIMVARGDLGVECKVEEVPILQKRIITACNAKGVPVITATQMLESMVKNPRPTRAEASDVANAIFDGTDAVMLSAETAVGAFPTESVKVMSRIITEVEVNSRKVGLDQSTTETPFPIPYAIGYSACHSAKLINATGIVSMTQSGTTARMIARFRPKKPILAITHNETTYNELALVWGVQALKVEAFQQDINEAVVEVINLLKSHDFAKTGDMLVITAGVPFDLKSLTNMIRMEHVE